MVGNSCCNSQLCFSIVALLCSLKTANCVPNQAPITQNLQPSLPTVGTRNVSTIPEVDILPLTPNMLHKLPNRKAMNRVGKTRPQNRLRRIPHLTLEFSEINMTLDMMALGLPLIPRSGSQGPLPRLQPIDIPGSQGPLPRLQPIDIPPSQQLPFKQTKVRPTHYVDAVAVVDYSVYQKHLKFYNDNIQKTLKGIREYYAFVYDGISRRFAGLTLLDGSNISLKLVKVVIWQTPEESTLYNKLSGTGPVKEINASRTLVDFNNYTNSAAGQAALGPNDHATLFHRYNATFKKRNISTTDIAGLALQNRMCGNYSVSMIDDIWGPKTITTTTHEIGHSFGAYHDGDNNYCKGEDNYIMQPGDSASHGKETNAWLFSSCSQKYISDWIKLQQSSSQATKCLSQPVTPSDDIPDVTTRLMGFDVSVDVQCQRQYGDQSIVCEGEGYPERSEMCAEMWCLNPSGKDCSLTQALEGSECEKHKMCFEGECLPDGTTPDPNSNGVGTSELVHGVIALQISVGILCILLI